MTRLTIQTALLAAATLCLSTAFASAQDKDTAPAATEEAAPAQQLPEGHPPLPRGHPDVSQMQQPQQRRSFHGGELPPGHPAINAEPDWHVSMRHVIVRPMADQLHVTEVWAITNPTEKSYIGVPAELFEDPTVDPMPTAEADATGEAEAEPRLSRVVLRLPLPEHVSHVRAGSGFAPDAVIVEDGEVVSGAPMTPGTTQYRVGYLLAAQDGVFTLPLASPTATDHAMVFLPDDGAEITAEGLTPGDTFKAGDKVFRVYMGTKLQKDAKVGLTIKVQPPAEETAAAPSATGTTGPGTMPGGNDGTDPVKMIAGFGGAVLLLAAVIMLFKPAKKQPAASVVL